MVNSVRSFLLMVEVSSWSLLLTVENQLGFFLLTVPPVQMSGSVFSAYGSPRPEIGFGLFCLRFSHRKLKKASRKQKDLNCK